jgi:hypothetical protein
MKIALICIILLVVNGQSNTPEAFMSNADAFLKRYVVNGLVNYKAVTKDFTSVEHLYKEIGNTRLDAADDATKKTFYINAYNLIVIYSIGKHFPVKSPMDISGFFDKTTHLVAGEQLSLNQLEKEKLLQPYKDERVHFALACAAISCPPLASFAFNSESVDQQLSQRTTLALNDPGWLKVNHKKKQVELSKIFEWYKSDFTNGSQSVVAWINQYRTEKIPSSYSITFYEYDWALNQY